MPKVKTIQQLKKELRAKEASLTKLSVQRKRLAARLAAIDRQIAALEGGDAPRRGRKPGPKPGKKTLRKAVKKTTRKHTRRGAGKSLNDFIKKVLGGAEAGMRPKDIMAAVRKVGYKTKSKDFYGLVAAALRDKTKFKRVSRGLYKNK